MIICISGTPGSGKSTLAKEIVKGFCEEVLPELVPGNLIIRKYGLGKMHDKKRDCCVVSIKRFIKAALGHCADKNRLYIIDSHLSHFLPRNKVELCIICKTPLQELYRRLARRRYNKGKIRENLDSEIFDICYEEALHAGHRIRVYNGTKKGLKQIIRELEGLMHNKTAA